MNSSFWNKLAENLADKIGSPPSIAIHILLILGNLSLLFAFDTQLVLLILTTWLSIEALLLSLFTQLVVTNDKKKGTK